MPQEVQNYIANAAEQAAPALIEAYLRLPEDKRDWQPAPTARSAKDQLIECALLSGYTVDVIKAQSFSAMQMETYMADEAKCEAMSADELKALLLENVAKVSAAIREVPDEALSVEIVMPWQTQTLSETIVYPYWNMTYHMAQINYIASLLGVLN